MVLGEHIGTRGHVFRRKAISRVTVWKYQEFGKAVQMVIDITAFSGYGHSCGIHSTNEEHIMELATKAKVSRMMVRQPQSYGNSGDWTNGMAFT